MRVEVTVFFILREKLKHSFALLSTFHLLLFFISFLFFLGIPSSLHAQTGNALKSRGLANTKGKKVKNLILQNKETFVFATDNFELPSIEKKKFFTQYYQLFLYSQSFSQGDAIYFELLPPQGMQFFPNPDFEVLYKDKKIVAEQKIWGKRGFIPISVLEKSGKREIKIVLQFANETSEIKHAFRVKSKKYPVSQRTIRVNPQYNNLASKKRIYKLTQLRRHSRKLKDTAYSRATDKKYYMNNFLSHPCLSRPHYVTSQFGVVRKKARYKVENKKTVWLKSHEKIHYGVDLRAPTSTPIYAIAKGKVILADKLYHEGNTVIIDHGHGLLSYYMHLNKFKSKRHRHVEAGTLLGYSGSTGSVTGPHLHLAVFINRVPISPFSFLALPIRD